MGCLGNSKTTEDQGVDEKERREANKKIEKQLQKERLAYKATHRLLLLGKAGRRGRPGSPRPELRPRAGPGVPAASPSPRGCRMPIPGDLRVDSVLSVCSQGLESLGKALSSNK
jgi:hypothetical protein